jgi:DNA-binding helix-hairpin-helix protein with protein kinase domain
MIAAGTTLQVHGERLTVGDLLGQGGEGAVYAVHDGDGAPVYALKWYFEHTAVDQRRVTLADLVERGAPHPRFLWPLGLIEPAAGPSFGYVMRLRPDGYASVAKLLALEVPRHEVSVARLAFEVAHSFLALHARGLCYRDISFGNVFFEPGSGRALICDNDNAGIDGVSHALVRGTPKFMAPEIVRREADPSKRTDQYSLAVLLFYLLFVGHPLEGTRTEHVLADRVAHARFYGYEPRFCFDPADDSNRPVPELHDHVVALWRNAPAFLRDLFVRCFTQGLADPRARVSDSEWCDAMMRLRDGMVACAGCDVVHHRDPASTTAACPGCRVPDPAPMTLRIANHRLAVSPLLRITAHHLRYDFDAETTVAVAERHPTAPGAVGLRNETSETWRYLSPDGRSGEVQPSRRVRLVPGMRVHIGAHAALVESATDR